MPSQWGESPAVIFAPDPLDPNAVALGPPYAQWADVELADAWFREALARSDEAAEARINDLPYPQQKAAVRAAWVALGNAFRSIETPPYTAPVYRAMMFRWYGANASPLQVSVERPGAGLMVSMVSEWYRALGKDAHRTFHVNPRYQLDLSGQVVAECVDYPKTGDVGACDYEEAFGKQVGHACVSNREGGAYTWNCMAYWEPFGGGADADGPYTRVLPPLKWFLWQVREVARAAIESNTPFRGARQVIHDARVTLAARNLRCAELLDVSAEEFIQVASGDQDINVMIAQLNGETDTGRKAAIVSTATTIGGIAAAALAATGVGAPLGALVGAAIAGAGALISVLPMARSQQWDVYYETPTIPRGREDSMAHPPAYSVEDPPGFRRRLTVNNIVLLASNLTALAGVNPANFRLPNTRLALDHLARTGGTGGNAITRTGGVQTASVDPVTQSALFDTTGAPVPWSTGKKVAAAAAGATLVGLAIWAARE